MIEKGFNLVTVGSDQRFMSSGAKTAIEKKKEQKKVQILKDINFKVTYFVYMLKSKSKKNVTYVGYTNNLKKRIDLHNNNKGAKFTRGRKWKLIYKEKYNSKREAISREYYIKNNRTLRNKIKNENINSSPL